MKRAITNIQIIPLVGKAEFLLRLRVTHGGRSSGDIELVCSAEALERLRFGLNCLTLPKASSLVRLKPKDRPHLSLVEGEEKDSS